VACEQESIFRKPPGPHGKGSDESDRRSRADHDDSLAPESLQSAPIDGQTYTNGLIEQDTEIRERSDVIQSIQVHQFGDVLSGIGIHATCDEDGGINAEGGFSTASSPKVDHRGLASPRTQIECAWSIRLV
jgi:hypothetical protein